MIPIFNQPRYYLHNSRMTNSYVHGKYRYVYNSKVITYMINIGAYKHICDRVSHYKIALCTLKKLPHQNLLHDMCLWSWHWKKYVLVLTHSLAWQQQQEQHSPASSPLLIEHGGLPCVAHTHFPRFTGRSRNNQSYM